MSVIWGEARGGNAHALSEIEVDEVSLVDRPATGKRFVLFKRRMPPRRSREEDANICSNAPAGADGLEQRLSAMEEMQKRAGESLGEVSRLRDEAARLETRVAALEAVRPARQSAERAPTARNLWSGVL